MNKKHTFLLSGGGTGGHIYPAIAIADEIKKQLPKAEIRFVGAKGKMEMEKVPKAGYEIDSVWISGFQRKQILSNLLLPFKLISSFWKCYRLIKKYRPNAVVGTGGYASAPLLFVASKMGIPTLIQEQNAFPGITNKWLGKSVSKICVAFESLEKFFPKEKIIVTGNPTRKELFSNLNESKKAKEYFELNPEKLTVLSFGGSLGARSINEAWKKKIDQFRENDIQLIWQTGKSFSKEERINFKSKHISPKEFIYDMNKAYTAADIIVSRAGASAISELSILSKPTILIPYPYATDDHQTKNAMHLVEKNAAILVKDSEAGEKLFNEVKELVNDKNKRNELSKNIAKFSKPEATEKIVEQIISLIG